MKVLLDSCISGQAATVVRAAGHDVVWAGDWPRDPGDEEILRRAVAEARVLATIDKDFGELVIVRESLSVGLIRLVGFRSRDQGSALVALLSKYETDLVTGAILTAEPWRVRVRALPRSPENRLPAAKISYFTTTFTGAVPPGDIGDGWVQSTTWPLQFSLDVDAQFDRPVTATSASLEVIRVDTAKRVARRVEAIASSAATIQRWQGSFESIAIETAGSYRIVIHVDGVDPVSKVWQMKQK